MVIYYPIFKMLILEHFFLEYSIFVIQIKAKAFLWHQIRCIMAILFLVAQGKEDPSIIDELLDVKTNPRYI